MKKLLFSLVMVGALSAFGGGATHSAQSILNPTVGSILITNTISLTNIVSNAYQTNSTGCNTNYNAAGIIYTNFNTIQGSQGAGIRYVTDVSATFCSIISTNANPIYTNDPTLFLRDIAVSFDQNGWCLTNYSIVADFKELGLMSAPTNLVVSLAPIFYGDLNTTSAKVDTANAFSLNFAGDGGTANRIVQAVPISTGYIGTRWTGTAPKGFRVLSVSITNAGYGVLLFDLRCIGPSPF